MKYKKMLPDGPKTFENYMSLPTDTMHVRLPVKITSDETHPSLILPGIYLTNTLSSWTNERLRSHGFTHIINIDEHIRECHKITSIDNSYPNSLNNNSTSMDLKDDFDILDLNFGEESYLTTVLPNCYKAVKFMDKALKNGGAILIVDGNNNQKCLTISTAYLMYKNNINFNDAFQRIKGVFKKAELERFFISQLYEYEPILQVQKSLARGHSCSRELRSAFLKRKKMHDDSPIQSDNHLNYINNSHDNGDVVME